MRIDEVHAEAFGPFSKESLPLAPGFTVVHGPNEAGKSTWVAATYAGLCCRRSARGRGTKDQQLFKERHKPWRGRGWRAGVSITLDDGTRLRLVQNLSDADVKVVSLPGEDELSVLELASRVGLDLEFDGAFDGSRLLGLNRDSARATIFVNQADVLRVLQDADQLQEFLQRAATSASFDTTVEHGLNGLEELFRVRVGQPHIQQRPLFLATDGVEKARRAADVARDAYHELAGLLAERRRTGAELQKAEREVARLFSAAKWTAIDELERRIGTAEQLSRSETDDALAPAMPEETRRVTELLGTYRERGEKPEAPGSPTSEELRQELGALPATPSGDVEPHEAVTSARQKLSEATTALQGHLADEPPPPPSAEFASTLSPDELRDVAAELERPLVEVDSSIREQLEQLRQQHEQAIAEYSRRKEVYEQDQATRDREEAAYRQALETYSSDREEYDRQVAEYERQLDEYERMATPAPQSSFGAGTPARTTNVPLVIAGIVVAGLGVGLGFAGTPLAFALALVGAALVVVGLRGSAPPVTQEPRPTSVARPPRPTAPVAPTLPAAPERAAALLAPKEPAVPEEVTRLEEREQAQRRAVADQEVRRRELLDRLGAANLPSEPSELRGLARSLDDAEGASERRARWEMRRDELRAGVSRAEMALTQALQDRGAEVAENADSAALGVSFGSYVAACRERAEQAREAGRRRDLEKTLATRIEREDAHDRALQAWQEAGNAVLRMAASKGIQVADAEAAADQLEEWLERQVRLREQQQDARERSARLQQVLDGSTLDDLRSRLEEARAEAGDRPDVVPADAEDRLNEWSRRRAGLADRVADLGGKITAMQNNMSSVTEAIEREAAAERELERVRELQSAIELAQQHLQIAKERVNASVAPALEATMRPWLPRLTLDRYDDLSIDPETLAVKVREPDGGYRSAQLLSHGTMEQVYLLLRLALADHVATTDETAPVILDDVTVQSDAQRTVAMMELLHDISRERQVVLFSQEQEVIDWAQANLTDGPDGLVELARR